MSSTISGSCIAVTGGAGFIGSHLVQRLLELGAKTVKVLDDIRLGSTSNLDLSDPRLELHTVDIGTATTGDLAPILQDTQYVFHLAAEKHNASIGNPHRMLLTNVQGTLNILEACARQGVQKLVFASSLYAYGRIHGEAFREDEIAKPSTVYGISKIAGENLVSMFSSSKIQTSTIRYLFVYGPRQWADAGYKSVIVKNFERLVRAEQPIIYGNGKQTLDYIYVSDAVDATIRVMTDAPNGSLFNVGSGIGVQVGELLQHMLKIAESSLPIKYEAPDWTANSYRVGDTSLINKTLGWKPTVSLLDGLQRTYDWINARC